MLLVNVLNILFSVLNLTNGAGNINKQKETRNNHKNH